MSYCAPSPVDSPRIGMTPDTAAAGRALSLTSRGRKRKRIATRFDTQPALDRWVRELSSPSERGERCVHGQKIAPRRTSMIFLRPALPRAHNFSCGLVPAQPCLFARLSCNNRAPAPGSASSICCWPKANIGHPSRSTDPRPAGADRLQQARQ